LSENNPIKRIFDLYTSDLTLDEIDRLIKKESAEVYEFYKNQMPKVDTSKNKFQRSLIFARSLFNAFLLKMTAARRIFYLAALIIFFVGYINDTGSYLILSFIIINLLLAFEMADKLTVKDELALARKIQNNLLSQDPPELEKYEVTTFYESAREVGGDYYDFLKGGKDEEITYIVIGDISGKGMAAALYMVRVQAIIQFLVRHFTGLKKILINVKKYFSENLRKEYFLTLLITSISKTGRVKVCRAGHTPVLHYKSGSDSFEEIHSKGIGIGLNDKGVFEDTLEEVSITTESNDILAMYTDGVTETMNSFREQYGEKRLEKVIRKNSDKSVHELKKLIINDLKYFRGNTAAHDDLTLVLLKAR
jgi:sigma-B regulation protein RsbU (phosphoserine phosphatase)